MNMTVELPSPRSGCHFIFLDSPSSCSLLSSSHTPCTLSPKPVPTELYIATMTNAPSAKERPTATPRPASTFPDDVPSAATAPSPGTAHGVTSTGLTVDRKAASRQEKSATSSMTGFHTEEDEAKLREETMPKGARLYLLMLGLALAT